MGSFSDVWATNSVPIFRIGHLDISFGATTPPAHCEDGDSVRSRNVAKPSHPYAAVCHRKIS